MARTFETEPEVEPRAERGFAAWCLGWPLTSTLVFLALVELGTWLPHYLTWPFWADHDVHASVARAWDLGQKPYRDFSYNNFPGTVYLFYGLGRLGGWGKTSWFYAYDSWLVLIFLAALLLWSVRRFGRFLPAMVGAMAFLSYSLSLDYAHAAQRDWQATCFAMLGILVTQAGRGRIARILSALFTAYAIAIRPQVVVFLPALVLAQVEGRAEESSTGQAVGRVLEWLTYLAGFVGLAIVPLALAGVFGDFLRSLGHVTYGSAYNRVGPMSVARGWLLQMAEVRWLAVPAAIVLLSRLGSRQDRATARVWVLAMAGVSFYKPISPLAHSYLDIPLVVVWSISLAVLAGMVLSARGVPASSRLAAVIVLLGMGTTTLHPDSCAVGPSLKAYQVLRSGREPEEIPPGYRKSSVEVAAHYPWEAYRGVLDYLRRRTSPTTKVANCLKYDPAINAVVDRPSAFPAESIAWLRMVNRADEPRFAEALLAAKDSVVLWSPGDEGPDPAFRIEEIEDVIRAHYEFEEVFGPIQVWRRKPESRP